MFSEGAELTSSPETTFGDTEVAVCPDAQPKARYAANEAVCCGLRGVTVAPDTEVATVTMMATGAD